MYALLVYAAGVSDSIRVASGLFACASAFFALFVFNECEQSRWYKQAVIGSVFTTIVLVAIVAAYPNSETLYKMAGVIGQDRGVVSVDGTAVRP